VEATGKKLEEIDAASKQEDAKSFERGRRATQARKAGLDLEAAVVKKAGVKSYADLDEATRTQLATRQSKLMIAAQEGRGFEDELGAVGGQTAALTDKGVAGIRGAGGRDGDAARFDALSAKVRKGQALKPSEAKEYTALSKSLDEAKAKKAGKGHKQTKMDKQLAAIDPSLRGVLTSGGETDAGGDLKVHDDVLSRSVFARANNGNGQGKDRSDGAGIGPGPNITNNYQYVNTTVTVPIDARSQGSTSDNLRQAADQAGQRLGNVIFTGATKLLAQKNAGGVMRSG